jgi:hypothetical protein
MTIDEMNLSPNTKRAAQLVLERYPKAQFTSGRRDMRAQAHAMAVNTIRYGMDWLGQTYKNQDMVRSLVNWVYAHLGEAGSVEKVTEGFYQTLVSEQVGQLAQFPHCRGDAFDIACPRNTNGQINEVETTTIRHIIEALPLELGLQLVLTHEGEHRVIHAQFNHTK